MVFMVIIKRNCDQACFFRSFPFKILFFVCWFQECTSMIRSALWLLYDLICSHIRKALFEWRLKASALATRSWIKASRGLIIINLFFTKGKETLFESCLNLFCRWNGNNPWMGYSPVSVAWTVDVDGVLEYIKGLLMKP